LNSIRKKSTACLPRHGGDRIFSRAASGEPKLYVHQDDQAAFIQAMNRQFLEEALAGNRVYELPTAELKGEIRFTC